MSYLIDTDTMIDYLGGDARRQAVLTELIPKRIGVSAITYMEVVQGTVATGSRMPGGCAQDQREA